MRDFSCIKWFEELPLVAKAVIGILSLVITFAALASQNIYLTVTVSITLLIIGALWFSIYVAVSKDSIQVKPFTYESRPRFSKKYRHLALVYVPFIVIIGVILLTYRPSRSFAISAFVGTATPTPTATPTVVPTPTTTPVPTIKTVSKIIAEDETHYRIEIITFNELERDIFVNHVTVEWIFGITACLCLIPPCSHTYRLSDQILIQKLSNEKLIFEAPIHPYGNLSGYQYNALGIIHTGCGINSFSLGFDTSLIFESKTYTALYIDIPKEFDSKGLPLGISRPTSLDLIFDTDVGLIK